MKSRNRIVIIGGGACGPKAMARARRSDPEAEITIIEQGSIVSQASCGLPYYVSGVIKRRGALIVRTLESLKNIYAVNVLTGTRVENIERAEHRLDISSIGSGVNSTLEYDRLVLSTGSSPILPRIEGVDLAGVYLLKDIADADSILDAVAQGARRAVIIGAGLIGMEMTEAFIRCGLEVTLVDALDSVLPNVLDRDMSAILARQLVLKGVRLKLGEKVVRFNGEGGRICQVVTEKDTLNADTVIMAVGVSPNTRLARQAGLKLGVTGAIAVNEYLQTSDPDIYAGGDCVENTELIGKGKIYAPMGSTANRHGRVIGTNVTGGSETFPGVLGTVMLKAFDYNVGRTGMGEKQAQAAGFDVVTAITADPEHATYYPGARDIIIKLIADGKSRRILGGQVMGRGDVAKRIDVLVAALTLGGTIDMTSNMDFGYAPPYNSALEPLQNASNIIRNKLSHLARGVAPAWVKDKLDAGEDFVLLDVRSRDEWNKWRIEGPQVKLLPLPSLRTNLGTLAQDKEIVVICRRGVRAYQAQRILDGAGFPDVQFVEGSLAAWPYDAFGGMED